MITAVLNAEMTVSSQKEQTEEHEKRLKAIETTEVN